MSEALVPTLLDPSIRTLASRLRASADRVTEPQRSRILKKMPNTLFISHTSLDDAFIKGQTADSRLPTEGSIYWICGEFFSDPFYHSLRTGAADSYSPSWAWRCWLVRACS